MKVESGNKRFPKGRQLLDRGIEVSSPAKINLFLEIRSKRPDGFHELETVMVPISLCDHLRFQFRGDGKIRLRIASSSPGIRSAAEVPSDGQNLIVRALLALQQFAAQTGLESSRCGIKQLGCDVDLFKRIPPQSGMGGASSNAASALLAGSQLWGLDVPYFDLQQLAAGLGSDVPFFMQSGAAICRGRGEVIEPIASCGGLPIVIAKPSVGLSTPEVFRQVKIPDNYFSADEMIDSLAGGNPTRIARSLFNRLQSFALPLTDQLERMESAFSGVGCLGHQMTGSGTGYFGIFANHKTARLAASTLSNLLPDTGVHCCQTFCSRVDGNVSYQMTYGEK